MSRIALSPWCLDLVEATAQLGRAAGCSPEALALHATTGWHALEALGAASPPPPAEAADRLGLLQLQLRDLVYSSNVRIKTGPAPTPAEVGEFIDSRAGVGRDPEAIAGRMTEAAVQLAIRSGVAAGNCVLAVSRAALLPRDDEPAQTVETFKTALYALADAMPIDPIVALEVTWARYQQARFRRLEDGTLEVRPGDAEALEEDGEAWPLAPA